jgi:hypothetical protein
VLQVASAPQFQVMAGGLLLFVLAAAWAAVPAANRKTESGLGAQRPSATRGIL